MTSGWTVILVRHGQAVSTSDNPQRPLTIVGRQQAETMATWLDDHGYRVEEIVHSEKMRARQTAKIIGRRLGIHSARVHQVAGLEPGDDPAVMADSFEVDRQSVLLVGHLPYLARLASMLLVGDPNRLQIRFTEVGVVVLERGSGGWQIGAVVGPDSCG